MFDFESLEGQINGQGLALIITVLGLALLLLGVLWFKQRRSHNELDTASQKVGILSEDAAVAGRGAAETAPVVARPVKHRDEATISRYIKIAEMARDQKALAGLYLERAWLELSKGERDAASELLRKSIMLATTHDLKMIHAEARLELADLAQADGDPTTACEHWQMARQLFHDVDAKDGVEKTDKKILSNGCPTDWVLTDF